MCVAWKSILSESLDCFSAILQVPGSLNLCCARAGGGRCVVLTSSSVKWPKAEQQQRQHGKPLKPPQFHSEKGGSLSKPSLDRPSMLPQQMRAAATERVLRIKAFAHFERKIPGRCQFCKWLGEGPTPSRNAVDHQIKATEDFIGRAKKRLLQHDVLQEQNRAEVERLAEAQELLQSLRVQVPEVPQISRSVTTDLEQLVAQLQSERDGLVYQLKN